MKQFLKRNILLIALTAVAVAISCIVVAGRWRVEAANKSYDVVLDYIELEWMVEQSEKDISWWLEQFKAMGITKVGLTEENLTTLMEDSPMNVTATMMGEIMQDASWRDQYPQAFVEAVEEKGFDRFDVMVEVTDTEEDPSASEFVVGAVKERFPAGAYYCGSSDDLPDASFSSYYGQTPYFQAGTVKKTYILLDGGAADALYGGKEIGRAHV